MALNPNIILASQPVNALGAMQAGLSLAEQQNGVTQQNGLANLYKTQGAGIANGDPGALNALAGFSPQTAVDIRGAQQGQAFDAEQMNMIRAEWKNKVADRAGAMSAAERAAKAAEIERSVAAGMAAQSPQQWDQIVTQLGATDLVGQFDNRTAIAFSYMGVADALKAAQEPKPADEYQRYVQEETGAGREPLSRIDFAQAKKGEGIVVTNADGSTIRVGGKSTGGGAAVSSPEAMVAAIDGILEDPALDISTGILSPLQNVPGTPQKRFQGRANQLSGQAFLQAFESLKGGGQITEIEGAKATQAIGRMDTAQSAGDYRQALEELKSILTLGQQRPVGWVYGQEDPTLAQGNAPEIGTVEGDYEFQGGDPASPNSWKKVR